MYRLIPASSVAAATPANSAQVVPIFATSSRIAAPASRWAIACFSLV